MDDLLGKHSGKTIFILGSAPSLRYFKRKAYEVIPKEKRPVIIGVNETIKFGLPLDYYFTIETNVMTKDWFIPGIARLQRENPSAVVVCENRIKEFIQKQVPNIRIEGIVARAVKLEYPTVYPGYSKDMGMSCAFTVATPASHFALVLGAKNLVYCGFDLCFTKEEFYFDQEWEETEYFKHHRYEITPVTSMGGEPKLTLPPFYAEIKVFRERLHPQILDLGVGFYVMDNETGCLPGQRISLSDALRLK